MRELISPPEWAHFREHGKCSSARSLAQMWNMKQAFGTGALIPHTPFSPSGGCSHGDRWKRNTHQQGGGRWLQNLEAGVISCVLRLEQPYSDERGLRCTAFFLGNLSGVRSVIYYLLIYFRQNGQWEREDAPLQELSKWNQMQRRGTLGLGCFQSLFFLLWNEVSPPCCLESNEVWEGALPLTVC